MICWVIKNGVPFDVAHCLDVSELYAYSILFAQQENGGKEWNWEYMTFVEYS